MSSPNDPPELNDYPTLRLIADRAHIKNARYEETLEGIGGLLAIGGFLVCFAEWTNAHSISGDLLFWENVAIFVAGVGLYTKPRRT